MKIRHYPACLCIAFLLGACATQPRDTASLAASDDTLYQALGGDAGIKLLADEFVFRLVSDTRIAHHFKNTDLDRFEQKLAEQFCVLSGGPCTYTGDSMEEVHKGLAISKADFNALVEDLQIAMENLQLPVPAQNRLLARLAPMRSHVIENE